MGLREVRHNLSSPGPPRDNLGMGAIAGLFGLALAAAAQNSYAPAATVAATRNGDVLFLGVPYRQRGSDQPEHGKIFAYQGDQASVIAMRGREQDYYDLSEPSVSADGTVIAYVGRRECTTEPCPVELRESTIVGVPGRAELRLAGKVLVSANGRYASQVVQLDATRAEVWLVDLFKEQRVEGGITDLPGAVGAPASNGSLLLQVTDFHWYRVTMGARELLPFTAYSARLSALGNRIVYNETDTYETVVYELSDGSKRRIGRLASGHDIVGMSEDGQIFLLLCASDWNTVTDVPLQVCTIRHDGTDLRQLTDEPGGVEFPVMTGDGRVVLYFSWDGKTLKRVDLATGAASNVMRFPGLLAYNGISNPPSPTVPGSMYALYIGGVDESQYTVAEAPLRPELQGFRVQVNGRAAPILALDAEAGRFAWERMSAYASPTARVPAIYIQVPWKTETSNDSKGVAVEVHGPAEGPFEVVTRTTLPVSSFLHASSHFLRREKGLLHSIRSSILSSPKRIRRHPARRCTC